jgi:hypothetical protein
MSADFPEYITVVRSVTYSVEDIVASMPSTPTDIQEVADWVQESAYVDLASPVSRHDLVFMDDEGNEL